MTGTADTQLEEAIIDGFTDLKELKLGSDEYVNATKSLAELIRLNFEEAKLDCEQNDREARLTLDQEKFKLDQLKEKEASKWYKNVPWTPIIGTAGLLVGTVITKRFEAQGYIFKLGDIGRNLVPKI